MSVKISSYKCNQFYSKDSVIKYDAKVLIMATSGGLTDVTLKDVFSFFTGAETMLPFGFDSPGGLNFDKVTQFPHCFNMCNPTNSSNDVYTSTSQGP